MNDRKLRILCIALSALPLIGCGDGRPTRVPVSGKVLIDGEPLQRGQVMVAPEGERASIGAIGKDGRFQLTCYEIGDGAVPGTHRATVTAAESISETQVRWHAPKKYSQLSTSGLEVTIDGPTDKLTINLTWDGGKPFIEGIPMR